LNNSNCVVDDQGNVGDSTGKHIKYSNAITYDSGKVRIIRLKNGSE
jgi:hypothetical protein